MVLSLAMTRESLTVNLVRRWIRIEVGRVFND
jgi:hypothetical protein